MKAQNRSPWKTVGTVLLLCLLLAIAAAAFIYLLKSANPVNAYVLLGIIVFAILLPLGARRGINTIARESIEANGAVQNGVPYAPPRGFVARNFILAFLPFWVIVPAFLLLPGALGIFPVIPGLVIAALRIEKTYRLFEDLGVSKRAYRGAHALAYFCTFAIVITLKIILNL